MRAFDAGRASSRCCAVAGQRHCEETLAHTGRVRESYECSFITPRHGQGNPTREGRTAHPLVPSGAYECEREEPERAARAR